MYENNIIKSERILIILMFTWLKKQFFRGKINVPDAAYGRADEAVTATEKAVVGARHRERGDALRKEGRLDAAVQWYRKAIAVNGQDAEAHNMLGDIFYERQALGEAEACYRSAVGIRPDFTDAQINLGLTLDEQGRFAEAEVCYRRVLEYRPDTALVHFNLGVTLKSQGRLAEAEASFRRVLEIKPNFSVAYFNLGIMQQQQGRLAEAESSYRCALEIRPDYADVYINLGIIFNEQDRFLEAEASLCKALEIWPNFAEANYNLGLTFDRQGRFVEAEPFYQKALQTKSDYAEAHCSLGANLYEQGRSSEAEICFRKALIIKPDDSKAYCGLGVNLNEQGKLTEAEICYRQALELKPDYADAHSNLANTLKDLGRLSEAEVSARKALEVKPGFAYAHNILGSTLKDLGRLAEAEFNFHAALKSKPDFAVAHFNLGATLSDQGRLSEAEASYRQALKIKPDLAIAHSSLLFTLNYDPDRSGKEIFAIYKEFDERFGILYRTQWRRHSNSRELGRRLKVGYVSPDFRLHAVRHFLEPLLSNHNKHVVEVFAYAELTSDDATTARYKTYVDHWIATQGMSDITLAERIRADGIDVLVDLAGHTGKSRIYVFMHKPAPVSVSWLGYGYTTGLTAIDYMLTDETSVPVGSEALFAEQPWRLATPGYVYRPSEDMGPVTPLPAVERGYVTLGTLSRAVRINHRTIRVWSAILKRLEGAHLVIDSNNFRDPLMQARLADKFCSYGIDRARLKIGYSSPPWDVLRGLDIGLDCFPHNSGTTLFETLYMGVPYITMAGRPSVGRLGSTILEGLGHPEWIARSEEEYIEKVVALATDLLALATLRRELRSEMQASALMDEAGFARKVESAYRAMWYKWCEQG